jgi:hypothetical protein
MEGMILKTLLQDGKMIPQQPQDIPRGMEIAKKFGLEILLPRGT